jgi:hypothetical protein
MPVESAPAPARSAAVSTRGRSRPTRPLPAAARSAGPLAFREALPSSPGSIRYIGQAPRGNRAATSPSVRFVELATPRALRPGGGPAATAALLGRAPRGQRRGMAGAPPLRRGSGSRPNDRFRNAALCVSRSATDRVQPRPNRRGHGAWRSERRRLSGRLRSCRPLGDQQEVQIGRDRQTLILRPPPCV